jgi:hypothetical protein
MHSIATELSLTTTDLQQLILVTIGRGVQNYTCPQGASKPVQTEANGGAIAQLFNINSAISTPSTSSNQIQPNPNRQPYADAMTTVSFFGERPVLTNIANTESQTESDVPPFISDEFPKVCFHEFNEENIPVFDCGRFGVIFGTLLKRVDAPQDAPTTTLSNEDGPARADIAVAQGEDNKPAQAIPWLVLGVKEGSQSRGITKVIRVVTAGGSGPETCNGVGPEGVSVDYAAQYWFFNDGSRDMATMTEGETES